MLITKIPFFAKIKNRLVNRFYSDISSKNVIVMKFDGGLGNQLFHYVNFLYLKDKFKDVYIDLECYNLPKNNRYRQYLLNYFNTEPAYCTFTSNLKQMFFFKLLYKNIVFSNSAFKGEANKISLYGGCNIKNIDIKKGQWFVEGFVSSYENYFLEFIDKIKFNDKADKLLKRYLNNSKYIDLINNRQTVSVHVRRGDYVNLNIVQYLNICTEEYYKAAINFFKEKYTNPVFYFFSEDLEWCKKTFGKHSNYIYVTESASDKYSTVVDMYLMSLCKNNIVANSTFSIWGAYLNKDKNKIVICPEKYTINGKNVVGAFLKEWIRISPDGIILGAL